MTTRVLHLLWELQPSGAETCLRVAAPRFAAGGVAADLLALGPDRGPYARVLLDAGYRVGHLPLDPVGRFVPRFLRLLVRERYDAVHIHVERANFHLALLARAAGVRTIVQSLHGIFDFTGALGLERRLQRAVMRRIGVRFAAVSQAVADTERRRFGNPTTIVPNFFDTDRFRLPTPGQRQAARAALGVPADAFAVCCVGNCSEVKNHAALLQAVAEVRRRRPVRLLHAGTGPEEAAERRLADALDLGADVTFLGQVDDVAPALFAADCFAMPSLHEGLGIAAMEALATGLPAVLADVPGLRSLDHPDALIRWAPPDAAAFAAALEAVAADPPPDAARRQQAATVHRTFGPDEPVALLLRWYEGR